MTQADFIYLEFNWHLSIWVSYLFHNEDIRFVLLIWFRNFSFCCRRCWHHHLQLRAPAPSLPYHDDHFLIVITTIVISITIFISVMRTAVWTDVYCHCHHCHLYVIEFRMTFSNISLPSLRQLLKFPARGKYEMLPRQCNAMQDDARQCNVLKRFSYPAVHRNIRQCYAMQDNVMQCKTM